MIKNVSIFSFVTTNPSICCPQTAYQFSRFQMLSGFLVKRLDNTYMFFHPSFREWLMRRDEGESTKFLCDLRLGHAAIAYRLSRLQAPLDGDKALELGHHILKAHVYRGVAPCWPSRDLQVNHLFRICILG